MQICFLNIHVVLLNKDFPSPLRGFSYFKEIAVVVSSKYFEKTTRGDCFKIGHSTLVNQFSIRSSRPEVFSRNMYSKFFQTLTEK